MSKVSLITHSTFLRVIPVLIAVTLLFSSEGRSQTTQQFTTPGTSNFVVPAGVTTVTVQVWGGGGGSSGRSTDNADGGGGGGGGGFRGGSISVTPGSTIVVTVGGGGAGAAANGGNGTTGGNSSAAHANGTVTANGGVRGTVTANPGVGGAGGTGSFGGTVTNQVAFDGGTGGDGDDDEGGGGGGGAGSTAIGEDGDDGNDGNHNGGAGGGTDGGAGGAGGNDGAGGGGNTIGGGGGAPGDNGTVGTAGARGQVNIIYTLPNTTGFAVSSILSCAGNNATATLSAPSITAGTYTVSYNITGTSNSVAATTANVTFSGGVGVLTTPVLAVAENDVLHITRITNTLGNYVDLTSNTNFTVNNCRVWYSYQTGNFNDFNTWTLDPSGTTFDNGLNLTPSTGDEIVILNGYTVFCNVNNRLLNTTTIQGGAILDMGTSTNNTLGVITGTGLMRIQGVTLPEGIYTDFVASTGGTIEYYNTGGTLSSTKIEYNNLRMTNTAGNITYVQAANLNVHGLFEIGVTGAGVVTWQINDASNAQRTITLDGDLTVGTSGRITVGTGNEASTTQHSLTLYGNITNSGIIKFFDPNDTELDPNDYGLSYPYPTLADDDLHRNELQGNAVTVTFAGTTNNTVTCGNTTDFYRFVVNKGTGQQAVLTVNSSNTNYFRLFGPSNRATTETGNSWEYVSNNALSIVNGTLELTGQINIPNICIGTTTSDYFPIPRNGALWLNGANVVLQISDNAPDVYAGTKDGRILISGLLRVTAGTLRDGFSKGLGSQDGGSYLQEGGTVNCWQFRPRASGTGVFSFTQTGGILNVGYGYALSGGKIDEFEEDYSRFDLRSPNCTFQMSGTAVLNVAKPTFTAATGGGLFRVSSTTGNYNVTGGTVNLYCGFKTATNSYPGSVNTTAPLYNVNIYEESATTQVTEIVTNGLVVLNNLTINTGNDPSLVTNNLNVTVGGNFNIQANTVYTPGTGTTTFNGTGAQVWTHNGTITSLAGSVVVNKTTGSILTLSGSQTFPDIANLTLTSGTLNDGGKILTVTTTLSNSAVHTGTGHISSNGPTVIDGNNGTFGTLRIESNTTVGVSGNQTVTSNLRLTGGNSSLDIGSNSFTVLGIIYSNNAETQQNFSVNKRIITSGLHNAGGLTLKGAAGNLVFPVGTGTLYTPNTINVTATTHGTITVRPVSSAHPNVSTPNESLLYYWRVTSSGYVGVTSVTHASYTHNDPNTDILLAGGNTGTYRAARFDPTNLTWATSNTTFNAGTANTIPDFNTGSAWTNVSGSRLDGEYTAGFQTAFNTITIYYSKSNGAWNAATGVWTTNSDHTTGNIAGPPCSYCPVVIGNGTSINHKIDIAANGSSCGTLALNTGSTLDCGTFTGLNMGTNTTGRGTLRIGSPNFPAGDFLNFLGTSGGTVEWYSVAASPNSGALTGALTYVSDDIDLGAGGGGYPRTYTNISANSTTGSGSGALFTVVFSTRFDVLSITVTSPGSGYVTGEQLTFNQVSITGTGGARSAIFSVAAANIINGYIIPSAGPSPQALNLGTYYNLVINPLAGKSITLPARNLTIYNNWVQQGGGSVTNNGARTLQITEDMTVSSGTFSLTNMGNTTITVGSDVSNSGTFTTTGGTHSLTVNGNLTNDGTIDFNNTGTVALSFTGTSNATFAGVGVTDIYTINVNKGVSQTPTVTFNSTGTITTTPIAAGWLTLTNGTFDFANTTSVTTTLSTSTYTIPPTAKLRVSGTNVTISITNNDADANDLFLNGALEIAGGTVNVGNTTDNNNNTDIEYSAAGTPAITVSSGSLWVKSSIRRSTATLTGALVYSQTGGSVTVGGIDSDTSPNNTRGVFEIDHNTGSSFTLTGTAILNVQRQSTATSCATSYADIYINPVSSNVTASSTITIGLSTTGTTQANLRVYIVPQIGNFTIQNGGGANTQTVWLFTDLVLGGNLTIPAQSALDASCSTPDADIFVAGDFNCSGNYVAGTNTTTFNGSGAQAATLSANTQFYDVNISKTAGTTLTLSGTAPTAPALNNLEILTGILNIGSINLTVNRNITINSSQVGTGYIVVYSTTGISNTITSSGGSFTNLRLAGTVTNTTINVSGDLTINGTLDFGVANRYLMIGGYGLTFGASALPVTGSGSTAFIRTNGVASDDGVIKNWGIGAAQTFTYQIGTSNNFTPVTFNLSVTGAGTLSVIPVNSVHLTYNQAGTERILNYYWTVKRGSTLNATASGNHTYTYPASLFTGSGGTLAAGYLDPNAAILGWTTSGHGGSATTTQMTFASTPTTNFPIAGSYYDYTVGTPGPTANPNGTLPNPIQPLYSRLGTSAVLLANGGGNWTTNNSWTTETDGDPDASAPAYTSAFSGPRGIPVVILAGARINIDLAGKTAYKTTINGLLYSGTAAGTPTTGHNLGIIEGTGTFRTATNTFPAGTYTNFVSAAGGTIEYEITAANNPLTMNSVNLTTAPSTVTYNNLSVRLQGIASGVVNMTNDNVIVNGNLTIPSSATLNNGFNRNITIGGDWTNSGTFTSGTGRVTFNGAADQDVSGTTIFNSLTVSKAGTSVILTGTATTTVNGTLTMSDGYIIPSTTHPLSISSTGSATGGSSTSYISGAVSKTLASGSFTFPVGKLTPGYYRPVTIANPSGADTWTVEYFGKEASADGYNVYTMNTANIRTVSQYEYWEVRRTSGTSADLTLSYNTGSYSPPDIGNVANLRVARWNGTQWDLPPGGSSYVQSGTNVAGTVTVATVTSFSPVTLASTDSPSPLPVTWVSLTGNWTEEGVLLNWVTGSEINNDHFEVERSLDGRVFQRIGNKAGVGNSKTSTRYSFVDGEASRFDKNYYRIKQIDLDGGADYSTIILVQPAGESFQRWLAFPNPVNGHQDLLLEDTRPELASDNVEITLFSSTGNVILNAKGSIDALNKILGNRASQIHSGVYMMRITDGAYLEHIRIVHH